MSAGLILLIMGILVVFEGLFIAFYTKRARRLMLEISRNVRKFKNVGIIEIVVGVILILIAVLSRCS